jgi:catechol-2,3-dioxygenase
LPDLRLAHVVFRTPQLLVMRDWYRTLTGARVVYENDFICFLTFDEEHHRIALVGDPRLERAETGRTGVDHVAFSLTSLDAMIANYERLSDLGVTPYWEVNHGPTTSLYYRDPDANQVELQIDNFDTREELDGWFRSGAFDRDPIGVTVTFSDLIARYRDGIPAVVVLARPGS